MCSNSCLILQTAAAACQSDLIRDIFHIGDRLCSNSCLILQTAAAAAYHSALIRDIFHIGDRLGSTLARCSCCYLPLRSRSRNTQHWRKSVLKRSPEFQTEKPAACYSALVQHIFHTCERLYPNARPCLQSVAPAASHSGLVREKNTLMRDGASTIA